MIWYYNNEGAASGPHDEKAMRQMAASGVLAARSLIWQAGMELWQEAGTLRPEWWQEPAANLRPEKSAEAGTASISRRTPQPLAPSEEVKQEKRGLLSRLFGRKK